VKYSIEKSFGVGVAGAVGALMVVAAACSSGSGATVQVPLNCGAGTTQVGNECVADGTDASRPGAEGGQGMDASAVDGSAGDASGGGDAMAGTDADAAPLVEDPCPTGSINVNCDSTCGATSTLDAGIPPGAAACNETACGNFTDPDDPDIPTFSIPATFRTPEMPMQASGCTGGRCAITQNTLPMLFSMTFRIAQPTNGNAVQVRVGAPWTIDVFDHQNVAVCAYESPEGLRSQECLSLTMLQTSPGGTVFMVWTNDPAAVAREIEVTEVPPASACQ
jgi:hypothetical protein